MEPNIVEEYHVFLASPSDMNSERLEVRRFFDSYNRHTAAHWNVRFTVVDYGNYATTGVGRPQDLINKQTLERFRGSLALLIGIMGQRFGSPTGLYESGTEEELEVALKMNLSNGYPEIKWFFQTIETFRAPSDCSAIEYALEQWRKVETFRHRLEQSNPPLFYGRFADTAEFRERFREDLSLWLYNETRPWHVGRKRIILPKIIDLPDEYYQSIVRNFESLDIAGIESTFLSMMYTSDCALSLMKKLSQL
jgi:hypothetical protein